MTGDVVLRIEGNAAGLPCSCAGDYVVSLVVPRPGHPGTVKTTPHRAHARRFPDAAEALRYWKQQHGTRSTDGMPNRPLTAFHISIVPAEDVQ
jgi:hypothetical protein